LKGFYPLSRAMLPDLIDLKPDEVKVLVCFFLMAPPSGKNKGKIVGFLRDFTSDFGMRRQRFYDILKSLDQFISVKTAKNGWHPAEISIKNFQGFENKTVQKKTYAEKLKDPRWQIKRLKIMDRDEFKCQRCERHFVELHVHHKEYLKGRDPWDYPDEHLLTLCVDCHHGEHNDGAS